jgi:N-acetylneuraminate synthase/N,N'-diacetyllegionaminate synthase
MNANRRSNQIEIIAEIGQNHNGDMGLAAELIVAAKEGGADVAKFQVYEARALFPKEGNPWFDYNCKTELSRGHVGKLAALCAEAGIEFMASAFDAERVHWLEELGVKRHKVASRSVRDPAILNAVAATKKPLLVSLGMWEGTGFPEIEGAGPIDYLFCISQYPTPLEALHLASIDFGRYAGFSDHTVGITAPLAAMALGARIIEKHFTLDKTLHGPDHEGSMTPEELSQMNLFRKELVRAL